MNKSTLSVLILLSCPLFAAKVNTKASTPPAPKCPEGVTSTLDLRHRESGGVGYSKGYSSLDYFLTVQPNKWEFLFNLRAHLFNDARAAGNAGIGMRYPIKSGKYMIGANFYYDFRQSSHLFAHQIGSGFEWIGSKLDFRINGYLPVGEKKHMENKLFDSFSGNNLFIRHRFKATLPSIEGEIGTPLPKYCYFAAGSYYLFAQEKDGIKVGNAWGGKVRGEVDLGKYFTLGAVVTFDRIFHTRLQGVLSLHIPLGRWESKSREKRCKAQVPVMRNEIIPIQTKKKTRFLTSSRNENLVQFIFVNNAAPFPGNGSIEQPFASLKEAEARSKPGDVIYVFPGDGTSKNMNEGVVLKEGQTLASSGTPLEVEGVTVPAQTPGQSPILSNIHPNQPVVTNPGNSDLSGFTILLYPWENILGNWGYDPAGDIAPEDAIDPHHDDVDAPEEG